MTLYHPQYLFSCLLYVIYLIPYIPKVLDIGPLMLVPLDGLSYSIILLVPPLHAHPAFPCHTIPCHAIPCHTMPYHAIPCHTLSFTYPQSIVTVPFHPRCAIPCSFRSHNYHTHASLPLPIPLRFVLHDASHSMPPYS